MLTQLVDNRAGYLFQLRVNGTPADGQTRIRMRMLFDETANGLDFVRASGQRRYLLGKTSFPITSRTVLRLCVPTGGISAFGALQRQNLLYS